MPSPPAIGLLEPSDGVDLIAAHLDLASLARLRAVKRSLYQYFPPLDAHACSDYVTDRQQGVYTGWSRMFALRVALAPRDSCSVLQFRAELMDPVRPFADVHIALSPSSGVDEPMYEIVLGGWRNTKSVVRRAPQGPAILEQPTRIQPGWFWICIDWHAKTLLVGSGDVIGRRVLLHLQDPQFPSELRYFCFSSWETGLRMSHISSLCVPLCYVPQVVAQTRRPTTGAPGAGPINPALRPGRGALYGTMTHVRRVPDVHCEALSGEYRHWPAAAVLLPHGAPEPPVGVFALVFEVTGTNDVHVAISPAPRVVDPMYEIVIGGWGNTRTVIRRCAQGPAVAECGVDAGLRRGQPLWIVVDRRRQRIAVGRGWQIGQDTIVEYDDRAFLSQAVHVAFSSWNKPIFYRSIHVCEYV